MPNKNARVIIPLVLVAWVAGIVLSRAGTPAIVEAALVVAMAIAIPVIVFYLMAEQGWSTLAKRYRSVTPFTARWQQCPTAQMGLVSVDHPEFNRNRLRLVSTLRVGSTQEALHLSMLFARVPVLGRFFPDVRIPWSAVTSARGYQAPGWVAPARDPGTLVQLSYDPNYTGTFVELEVGAPPVFLQLPLPLLGDAPSRLGLAADGQEDAGMKV